MHFCVQLFFEYYTCYLGFKGFTWASKKVEKAAGLHTLGVQLGDERPNP